MLNLVTLKDGRKAFIIRTSDRLNFRKCRRRWAWSSHLKRNLGPKNLAAPLWFGSAIHYALEDFHGYRAFEEASDAFQAYCVATAKNFRQELPDDAGNLLNLGTAMMQYYQHKWLKHREADITYECDGHKQVEVTFEIPIIPPIGHKLRQLMDLIGCDVILYRGTFDRVAIDEYGNLWIVEYKTAKRAETGHYLVDTQCSTYVWAAGLIYDRPISGVIYQQFIKTEPKLPPVLKTGKVSTASNLLTSYPLYRERLQNLYGDVEKAPRANIDFLWDLAQGENPDRDRYIIREKVFRNAITSETEFEKILLELEDMMNPDLALYPNPSRDCAHMCSFNSACVSYDDGSDWEFELLENFASRDSDLERYWRRRLPDAKGLAELRANAQREKSFLTANEEFSLEGIQFHARNEYLQQEENEFLVGGNQAIKIEIEDPTFTM
ncbi:MAG: PD-(D/E)XK nuclease family protein [Waterburya sp.]